MQFLSLLVILGIAPTLGSFVALADSLPPIPTVWETPTNPIPPSQDSFYTAPRELFESSPGTALRIRAAPGNITSIVANCSAAFNILYRTTDTIGNASFAVTTLLLPSNLTGVTSTGKEKWASSPAGRASTLLSYQIAYDAASVDASPSYTLNDATQVNTWKDFTAALGLGWAVVVPDYESPQAAFTAGFQSGYATLDGVRAVISLAAIEPSLGLLPDARAAIWGYSGGSIATGWAAELHTAYAPDLRLAGAVVSGVIPSIETAIGQLTHTQSAGLVPAALLGITAEFPYARQFLVSKLKTDGPYNATTFLAALNTTSDENFATFAFQNISDYFIDGDRDIYSSEMVSLYNTQGLMGHRGVPTFPMSVFKAIADEFSPIGETDTLVANYCKHGANILYERNLAGEHVLEFQNEHSRALAWLASIFDGTYSQKYQSTGCTIINVNVTDPSGPTLA